MKTATDIKLRLAEHAMYVWHSKQPHLVDVIQPMVRELLWTIDLTDKWHEVIDNNPRDKDQSINVWFSDNIVETITGMRPPKKEEKK